jgi:hypothetical protein
MQGHQLPGGIARRLIGVALESVFGILALFISPLCLDSWKARVMKTMRKRTIMLQGGQNQQFQN